MPLLWWRELRGMAVQPASTPLPPNVHVVYEVLCDEGPQTGRALERLLARRGVVVPVDRLLELPRRYPGAFAIDAAERLAVPPDCDRCGARGCDTCQRDVGAAACRVCGRTVCRDCRGEGAGLRALCADCAAPRRLPEADLRYCRAWALGGQCRLLVGERSAMLLGGPEGPLVLVPDADLDDPVRRRLRALAAALRVPPEIGLRWSGPAPAGSSGVPSATTPAARSRRSRSSGRRWSRASTRRTRRRGRWPWPSSERSSPRSTPSTPPSG